MGIEEYHYSYDIWGLGCTFAAVIFKIDYMFPGPDKYTELAYIASILGTDDLYAYLDKFDVTLPDDVADTLVDHPKKDWSSFVNEDNEDLANDEALELIS